MINMDIDLEGVQDLIADLVSMERKINVSLARVLNFVVQSTAQRAKNRIRGGSRSGAVYVIGGRTHQASAPGEPPANLSGALAASITYTKITDNPESGAEVGSSLDYAGTLEQGGWTEGTFGLVYVEARPFLLPSFEEAVAEATKRFQSEFARDFG